ncbi:hypothetical protein ABH16_04650 [Bacillus altitudinis]|uniref:hypothetical protein n=1 Tax=Bacillus altitudinis TaxID=293387 RepID=UPI0009386E97|nr:hypothetical protein [Bacillus altitudinis]APP15611.1 hypothetical protein BS467_07630 [Bacillus altitudinis]MBG9901819.1 hypothetical protein [Bacillus altitudinis]
MREIKTEAQTLDLSKKVTVEVSLAELIVLAASAWEVKNLDIKGGLSIHWKDDFKHLRESVVNEADIASDIDKILASHGVKEAE